MGHHFMSCQFYKDKRITLQCGIHDIKTTIRYMSAVNV
jgi:hypothetical protein